MNMPFEERGLEKFDTLKHFQFQDKNGFEKKNKTICAFSEGGKKTFLRDEVLLCCTG